MKLNPIQWLFGSDSKKRPPVLLAVTPPRTGERTLLGVENLLNSLAVPEPFSLEMAGDSGGVTLLARCRDQEVVRGQITAHYPQARIHEISEEEDPLRLGEGEEAWGMTLSSGGPDYLPLRTFRDDDLLDPGSDPLIALLGALSSLKDGERIVARLLLRSLGPDWSQAHLAKALKRPDVERRDLSYTYTTKPLQTDGVTMAILGVGALAALRGYFWIQDGETWKAILLGAGFLFGAAVAGWGWWRWKRARSRVYDPILIKEKVSRIAFDGQLQVTAFLRQGDTRKRSRELLGSVAAAYRHYDHPAGARFKVSKVRPAVPSASLQPPGPGLFGKRSVLGVREVAALWHPPGARDETPLVERSGARVLFPSARGVRGGAPVGHTTAGTPRDTHFPEDLLRRHHLYVARTRMGKSTLMHHVVAHKMREKAEGRDNDAFVVVDPHTDLVSGLLRHVPESLADQVRLIDLADERALPASTCLIPGYSPIGTAPPTRWFESPVGCGTSGDPGCSPSWSRPSRPCTKPMSGWKPSSNTRSWTGSGSSPTPNSRTGCWPRSATPICWSGGAATSGNGTVSTRRRRWPPSRPASPTTHPPSGLAPSSVSPAPPSTCAR